MAEIGNEELWNTMLERYIAEGNAQERGKILYGLGTFRRHLFVCSVMSSPIHVLTRSKLA